MPDNTSILTFLTSYSAEISSNALLIREVLLKHLPGIVEQIDVPAKMIAYSYGNKYSEMICTLIPSKKGLKLGFYKGNELPDPNGLLQGNGKISRYVDIKNREQIKSTALCNLILNALAAYKERTGI